MISTRIIFIFWFGLFLTACNGSSGENEAPVILDPDAPVVISIKLLDHNCQPIALPSIQSGNTFCIQALLTKNNAAVSATVVNFSASLGTLASNSKLTDNTGLVETMLHSTNEDIGASTLNISSNNVTATIDYEFVASNKPDPDAPIELSIKVLDDNCQAQILPSYIAGTSLCIQAHLSKNNLPQPALSVTFSTPLGTLRQSSKLTNENGIAQVFLDSEIGTLGSADVTATFSDIQSTASYEFIKNDDIASELPALTISMFKDGIAGNSIKQGETAQIQASLTNSDGTPITNQIISFTAELGSLNTTTALTNAQGVANIVLSAATDSAIGATTLTSTYLLTEQNTTISQQFNYQIIDADSTIVPEIKAGYFDNAGNFIQNKIGISLPKNMDDSVDLSAGGTLGVKVALVNENNERILTPTTISFTSNCATNQQANIDEQVLTINGEASATYEDVNCAGSSGNQDQIIASVSTTEQNITLTQIVNLQPEDIGAIEFITATPDSIVLKGTGGQGKQEISTLSFLVKGRLGNPLAQQRVDFSLDTNIGGLNLSPLTAFTNSQGEVSTKVTSGNVPTVVRVAASAISGDNALISTQSDLLSVNTGLADQNSITLATTLLNPEAHNINGVEVNIIAWLADSFNNPVPDGTTVNFTTEGGQIEPSCQTENGSCTVKWESAEPKVYNHRITILATAIGHETFFDSNGNNVFDDADGEPVVIDVVSSGFGRSEYLPSGFIDMPEAWRDDNENNEKDPGELFIDFESDVGSDNYTNQDGKFNGPHCLSMEKCGENINKTINVRKALRMVMASSDSYWSLYESLQQSAIASNYSGENATGNVSEIQQNDSQIYTLYFSDTALQTMPAGTTVTISASQGELAGNTNFTVGNTLGTNTPISQTELNNNISFIQSGARFGGSILNFTIRNNLESADLPNTSTLNINITSPGGVQTNGLIIIDMTP